MKKIESFMYVLPTPSFKLNCCVLNKGHSSLDDETWDRHATKQLWNMLHSQPQPCHYGWPKSLQQPSFRSHRRVVNATGGHHPILWQHG
eukprot:5640783-Amphidinium_carterae.1